MERMQVQESIEGHISHPENVLSSNNYNKILHSS
jgi:hypothetical protein